MKTENVECPLCGAVVTIEDDRPFVACCLDRVPTVNVASANDMKTITDQKWCYYIPVDQDPDKHGGYVPSLVRENEAGHSPMLGNGKFAAPWVWGKTFEEAQRVCAEVNARRGISEQEAAEIVASSMAASRH